MGTKKESKQEPPKPPAELHDRTVAVQPAVVNTVEVPCDPRDANSARWFDTSTRPLRTANQVTTLVGGDETFAMMADAIATANAQGHYIYMLNWWIDLDVNLRPGTTLWSLLASAVANGVQVRGMFWDQVGSQNSSEVTKIGTLKHPTITDANGAAILDNNTLDFGSHHQKILVVKGEALIGFCGGVDFNTDRISSVARQPGSPMHDVHCRIIGPAAWDLLQIFVDRWNDHADSPALDTAKGKLRASSSDPIPTGSGDQFVQIGRTFGNGAKHAGINNRFGNTLYTFAPRGEQTCRSIIFKGIEQAQQFIYVQDQYLQSMEASNKLLAALPNIKKLIILIPHPTLNDHPNIWRFQKAFIDNLKGDPKVAVCYLKAAGATPNPKKAPASDPGTYVHSKIWIIDDKFAVIGSANCNNRGYTHDSEVVAGIYDESKDTPCTLHLAHALRIRLWALHLNLKPADVFDPIGSAAHWFSPTVASRIAKFDQNADKDSAWAFRNQVSDAEAEPIGS